MWRNQSSLSQSDLTYLGVLLSGRNYTLLPSQANTDKARRLTLHSLSKLTISKESLSEAARFSQLHGPIHSPRPSTTVFNHSQHSIFQEVRPQSSVIRTPTDTTMVGSASKLSQSSAHYDPPAPANHLNRRLYHVLGCL